MLDEVEFWVGVVVGTFCLAMMMIIPTYMESMNNKAACGKCVSGDQVCGRMVCTVDGWALLKAEGGGSDG